jgi:hypothetical protein
VAGGVRYDDLIFASVKQRDVKIKGGIMKNRFLTMSAVIFVMLTTTGCEKNEPEIAATAETVIENHAADEPMTERPEEEYEQSDRRKINLSPINYLQFSSIEELLDSYISAREGRESSDSEIARITRRIDLASLNSIHLPATPREEFRIAYITVSENSVTYLYVPVAAETTDAVEEAFMNKQYIELIVICYENNDTESSKSALEDSIQRSFQYAPNTQKGTSS